jgi:hypothetical protein
MEVQRFKRNGQRIWRITWGSGGRFLGSELKGVWPLLESRKTSTLTPAQLKYRQAAITAGYCYPNQDEKGFLWLIEGYAEKTIEIVKVALTGWKPMPRWAILAMGNGWEPPKGWTPDDSIGEGFKL